MFKKKSKKKESPRTKLVQTEPNLIAHLEDILHPDAHFRFLTRTKSTCLSSTSKSSVLMMLETSPETGIFRGCKVLKHIQQHPLIFEVCRHTDNKKWLGFSDFMDELLLEDLKLMDQTKIDGVNVVRKLLMMPANKRIPLSKIYHNRLLFGVPEDFRDRAMNFPEHFKVVAEEDGKRILELVNWDPSLAVTALEREFMVDEDKVKGAF